MKKNSHFYCSPKPSKVSISPSLRHIPTLRPSQDLRVLQYFEKANFKAHVDSGWACQALIYLNEDFEGGYTEFPNLPAKYRPRDFSKKKSFCWYVFGGFCGGGEKQVGLFFGNEAAFSLI